MAYIPPHKRKAQSTPSTHSDHYRPSNSKHGGYNRKKARSSHQTPRDISRHSRYVYHGKYQPNKTTVNFNADTSATKMFGKDRWLQFGAKEQKIEIIVSLNTCRSISATFEIKYPIQSNYPLKYMLKQIQKNLQIYHKLQKIFVRKTGIEITNENILSLLQKMKTIDIMASFGENYFDDLKETSYYNLYNGITYPYMNMQTKRKIVSILKKRESNEFGYKQTTSAIYQALKHTCQNTKAPIGLSTDYINDDKIINKAIWEVNNIFKKLVMQKPYLNNGTNLHFYINTPYYTRNEDSWPMFQFDDENVLNICKCVRIAANKLLKQDIDVKDPKFTRFNVIVRKYKYGDYLGFHSDGPMFDDNICGIVLTNKCPSNGLMFYHYQLEQFMVDETERGCCWLVNDCARWQYEHGLYIDKSNVRNINNSDTQFEYARISISFRWYRNNKVIPPYNSQNDII